MLWRLIAPLRHTTSRYWLLEGSNCTSQGDAAAVSPSRMELVTWGGRIGSEARARVCMLFGLADCFRVRLCEQSVCDVRCCVLWLRC